MKNSIRDVVLQYCTVLFARTLVRGFANSAHYDYVEAFKDADRQSEAQTLTQVE